MVYLITITTLVSFASITLFMTQNDIITQGQYICHIIGPKIAKITNNYDIIPEISTLLPEKHRVKIIY